MFFQVQEPRIRTQNQQDINMEDNMRMKLKISSTADQSNIQVQMREINMNTNDLGKASYSVALDERNERFRR